MFCKSWMLVIMVWGNHEVEEEEEEDGEIDLTNEDVCHEGMYAIIFYNNYLW